MEELGRLDLLLGLHIIFTLSVSLALLDQDSQELRETRIRRLINGEVLPCPALTEPGCCSDAAAIRTTAIKQGEHYILRGEKTSISLGLQAEIALVFAKNMSTLVPKGERLHCFHGFAGHYT